jgi:hypothetical protein
MSLFGELHARLKQCLHVDARRQPLQHHSRKTIMNKISQVLATATVAAIGLASTAAFAEGASYDYPQAVTSNTTRAQVQSELAQAKRDGSIKVYSISYNHMAAMKSVKSRAEVQAEVVGTDTATRDAMLGEDSGSFALSHKPARSAGTVLATR